MEQIRLFETAPAIEPGSVYFDLDRRRDRAVRVESVEGEYAVCRSELTGRTSRIRVDRLCSGRFGTDPVQAALEPADPDARSLLPAPSRTRSLLGRLRALLRRVS
jgi:hypothetical protein